MKAHREPPKFTPVTLVLETQEEVDAIYAFLRHTISREFGIDDEPDSWKALEPYMSGEVTYSAIFDRVNAEWKRKTHSK